MQEYTLALRLAGASLVGATLYCVFQFARLLLALS